MPDSKKYLDSNGLTYLWNKLKSKFVTLDTNQTITGAKTFNTQITGSISGNAGTVNNHTVNSDVPANAKFTDTTYDVVSKTAPGLTPQLPDEDTTSKYLRQDGTWFEPPGTQYVSKQPEQGGTDVSLVLTGEKYTWNSKADGNHTHSLSIATNSGTSAISLSANTKYKLTAGGSDYIFTTPKDTTYENKTAASGGTDVSLVTTGDKYNWDHKTSNTGTVTKVSTGVGLTGGDVTTTGTIKAKLKSETASTLDSASMGSTADRQYAVGVDKSGYLSVNVPWENDNTTYTGSDGVTLTGTNFTNSGVRSIATGDNNGEIKVNTNGTNANVKVKGINDLAYIAKGSGSTKFLREDGTWQTTPDNNTTYTLDQDETDGHKITLTPSTGTATTITIPDNDTTYTGSDGITLTGTNFTNSGVRSIATGSSNGTISVNTNGTSANVSVKGLKALAYKDSLTASDVGAVASTLKGAANGVAELDANGLVPSSQLPSYVDDIIEGYYYNGKFYKESTHTTEITGETGKIYVDLTTEKTYRYSGSGYVEISASLALGETSSTAYRGDRGKIAYDHSQSTHARTDATKTESSSTNGNIKINGTETTVYTHPTTTAITAAAVKVGKDTSGHVVIGDALTKSDVGLSNVGNFKAVSTVASQGLSSTEQSNARANIGAGTSSLVLGNSSTNAYYGDKGKTAYDHSQVTSGNPHNVTKSDVGLGDVGNFKAVSTVANQGLTDTEKSNARANIGAGTSSLTLGTGSSNAYYGDKGKIAYDHSQAAHARTDATAVTASSTNGNIKINGTETTVYTHPGSGTNPHGTTKSDVGLGNVGNFKAVSTVANQGLTDTEKSNARANIGAGTSSLTLGTTSSTAYYGDKGKTAYDHSQVTSGNPHNVTKSDVGLGNVGNFKAVSTVASQGLTDTEKSNARTNIGAGTSSLTLGTSSSTAYRGDYGNTAYSHATDSSRLTTATASGLYKVASTAQGHIASLTAVQKSDITGLGIPGSNTTYSLTQDSSDGHKITLTPSSGTAQTVTIPDNNTTYTLATGDANGQIKVTPNSGSAYNVDVKGLAALAYKSSLSKSDVGLGNVDNTSDANKPISTATQNALNKKAKYDSLGSCADYQRVVIGLCELSANANSGSSSHTSGSIVTIRSNGLVPEYVSNFVFQDNYSTAKSCNYSFMGNFENTSTALRTGEGFRACTFTYNSKYYAGLEFYQTQARGFYWWGEGSFTPFMVAYYNFNTGAVLNDEINNSIVHTGNVLNRRNITTDIAKKATNDSDGNAINTTYLKKSGGDLTGALTRTISGSTIATTTLFQVSGATDGLKVDYGAASSDKGLTRIYTTDDADAQLSLGSLVGSTYKEAINITNGVATISGSVSSATKATQDGDGNVIKDTYVKKAGDTLTGDLTLYVADNSATPALIFQRGTLSDSYNDWKIYDSGGKLYFAEHGTSAWTNRVNFDTNGTITATKFSGQLDGTISSSTTATTQTQGDNSTKVATTAYVDTAITNLPEPMIFKGSLGTGGTITSLPTASASNEGYTYKVITAGTYASQAAKVGDTFISDGSTWVLIPSGDEPSGTVTSITIKATSPIAIDSSSAITTSGTRTLSHATSGVTAGTYRSVTVNDTGHVTAGTNPTTLSGYGITDAKIASGVITLGSNTITPLTSSSSLNAAKLTGTVPAGCYTDTKYTNGTGLTLSGTEFSISKANVSTIINLLDTGDSATQANDYIITQYAGGGTSTTTYHRRKASNVVNSTLVKAALGTDGSTTTTFLNKAGNWATPANTTYSLTQDSSDGHKITLTPSSGTAQTITIPDNDTKNTAGSSDTNSKIFLVGATSQAANAQTYSHDTIYAGTDGHVYSNGKQAVNLSDTQALTNKTYNGYTLAAACAKGVVTTVDTSANLPTSGAVKTFVEGKGYSTLVLGNTATTAAAGNHTHTTTIAADSGTNALTLAASTKYKLTTGGTSFIFTTPPNTTYAFETTSTTDLGIDSTTVKSAIGYVNGLTKADWNYQQIDGCIHRQTYSDKWIHQIFGDYRTGQISVRGKNNGTWQSWRRVLDESNYSSIITGYATSGHTHNLSIATDSGTNQLSMSANTKYKLTAGGSTYIFTTPTDSDTKNTAGSTDTSSKIFLIGATSQAANPQTYSDNEVYATSGVLTTKSVQVGGTAATMQYNSTEKCIEFIFA